MGLNDEIKENTNILIEDRSVELPEEQAATESLKTFVEFLISQKYLDQSDFPIESGYKRYLINTDPIHQDGDQMIRPAEIEDDVFVETNYNPTQIKSRILKLYDLVQSKSQ